ncbi:MAG TPA: helix-turn-helix transcriptional regulator, partial [Acidimicrobiales bacterium]|nr:helix-turn-helix transcriptional regulator [Acidimicrobiales bacterium]
MDSATGEAPARRRRARGRKLPSTPAAAGTVLVRARQELGLGLVDVRDRTGVSLPVLEALETGDLTGLDPDLAALGLRRYADLMGLDGEGMCRALNLVPQTALVGAGTGSRSTGAVPALSPAVGTAPAAAGFAGHLRQYPGDGMHLQAFTQTAQVPSVGGGLPAGASSAGGHDPYGSGQVFGTTGMYPATPPLRIRQVVRPAARPV